jgi:hypothetical protein
VFDFLFLVIVAGSTRRAAFVSVSTQQGTRTLIWMLDHSFARALASWPTPRQAWMASGWTGRWGWTRTRGAPAWESRRVIAAPMAAGGKRGWARDEGDLIAEAEEVECGRLGVGWEDAVIFWDDEVNF